MPGSQLWYKGPGESPLLPGTGLTQQLQLCVETTLTQILTGEKGKKASFVFLSPWQPSLSPSRMILLQKLEIPVCTVWGVRHQK